MIDLGAKLGIVTLVVLFICYREFTIIYKFSHSGQNISWKRCFMKNKEHTLPLSIHIFAWRRSKSLERLCKSISRARYQGHRLPLHFHVDGEPLVSVVDFVEDFKWKHGKKFVHLKDVRLGMPAAIVESWKPDDNGDEEFALFLEDDIAVSRAYIEWCIFCINFIQQHRKEYGDSGGLIGCSLYTPFVNEIGRAKNAWSPPRWSSSRIIGQSNELFYFQLPCSWGAIYSSVYWKRFLTYYLNRKDVENPPIIPNSRTNTWFKSWKRMLLELMVLDGAFLLYPSFNNSASFSTNFFELGMHNQPEGSETFIYPDNIRNRDRRFTVPLIHRLTRNIHKAMGGNFSDIPWKSIPWVNLHHRLVSGRDDFFADEITANAIKQIGMIE